ncbi:MAG TPA: hypothetical protein VK196_13475 [Magnetospirillum sp.]|nr:hypothetical protein [Magnetospirillum sp.]
MNTCHACRQRHGCRVPRDLARFHTVSLRLEEQQRNPLLRDRLRHFVERSDCLVEAGYVDAWTPSVT